MLSEDIERMARDLDSAEMGADPRRGIQAAACDVLASMSKRELTRAFAGFFAAIVLAAPVSAGPLVRLGKGRKDRIVPIGERAVAWACKYLYEVRPRLVIEPDCSRLFLSLQGGPIALASLTDTVRDYVIRSGVGKPGACHIFRHTMATLMQEGGADVRFIQEMLGHANLQTTQIYTRVSIQKLKAIHDATHPGAKLRHAAPSPAAPAPNDSPAELLSALAAEAAEEEGE